MLILQSGNIDVYGEVIVQNELVDTVSKLCWELKEGRVLLVELGASMNLAMIEKWQSEKTYMRSYSDILLVILSATASLENDRWACLQSLEFSGKVSSTC